MLTQDVIQKLKRVNISVNSELTAQRTREALKSATRGQKNAIDALAGVKRASLNRVYVTGSISAKIAAAIAQTLDISPFYLTGEADERGDGGEETLRAFLEAKGYASLAKKAARPVRRRRAADADAQGRDASEDAAEAPAGIDAARVAGMTEEEAAHLLHSMFIRAKYSDEVQAALERVKALLA